MKKILIVLMLIAASLWFSLKKPVWIEVFNKSDIVKTVAVKQAILKSEIAMGYLFLPLLEHNLKKLKLVKKIMIKQLTGGGIRIVVLPEEVIANLTLGKVLTVNHKVIDGHYFADLPVYDCEQDKAYMVEAWHKKQSKLLADYPVVVREVGYDAVSDQWRVLLQNYTLILLGRSKLSSLNLQRWLEIRPYFHKHNLSLENHIFDMRYPDGFAYYVY